MTIKLYSIQFSSIELNSVCVKFCKCVLTFRFPLIVGASGFNYSIFFLRICFIDYYLNSFPVSPPGIFFFDTSARFYMRETNSCMTYFPNRRFFCSSTCSLVVDSSLSILSNINIKMSTCPAMLNDLEDER